MTIEQYNALKAKHDTAVRAMKEAAEALNAEGLTEARRQELNEKFARAEKDESECTEALKRGKALIEAERRAAEEFMEREEREGRTPDKRDHKEVEAEYRAAFKRYLTVGEAGLNDSERRMLAEKRGTSTQVAGTAGLGGNTVPVDLANEIIRVMKAYGGVLSVARTITTDGGNQLNIPSNDDTGAKAVLVAEIGSATVQDTTFTQRRLDAFMYRDLIRLSYELIQDSAFDIEAFVAESMGVRFGRAANESLTTGTGSNQPNGVVTASTLGKTAASATAFTFAEIIDLIHSVDPEYRRNARFMMHDNVLAYIKKLSIGASDARPLWQPSFVTGEPATIDGYQYVINQDMDSTINASSKLILFGDFSKYWVRQVRNLQILRNEALYMGTGEIGLFGFARWDGELMDTTAIKHLITAA